MKPDEAHTSLEQLLQVIVFLFVTPVLNRRWLQSDGEVIVYTQTYIVVVITVVNIILQLSNRFSPGTILAHSLATCSRPTPIP